jgi:uncharacterized protein YbaR (Trm112 family)
MEGGSTERIVGHSTYLTEPQGIIKNLNSENTYALSKTLLDILACPACKGQIKHDEAAQKLVCVGECQRRYPIHEGIPVMLIDEAELPDEELG